MAGENKKSTFIFSDIASIAIKVFVGLVSFQLLAPYIWNYLSELVHFRKIWSFRIISGIYFILPVLIIALWWKDKKQNFISLANPAITDNHPPGLKAKMQKPLKVFVNLSWIMIIFLLIVYFFILFFPFESCWLFYLIQVISLAGIVILIVSSKQVTKINFEFFDDFTPEIKLAANEFKKFRTIFYLFFALVLALEFFYFTGRDYLKKDSKCVCENTNIRNRFKLENAFNTVEFKASLTASRKNLEDESQKLLLKEKLLKFQHADYVEGDLSDVYDYGGLLGEKNKLKVKGRIYDTDSNSVLGNQYRLAHNRIIAFSNLVDSLNVQLENYSSDLYLGYPPYELDTLMAINQPGKLISDASVLKIKIAWFDQALNILRALEEKTDRSARKQLAIVIGNLQMKGIFLFFNILIFLSCLYVFFKTNKEILLLLSNSTYIKGKEEIKNQTDKGLADNEGMLDSVWLYLTVILGLLIPLLKPVNEDNIVLDRPFQMFTIPGQIKSEGKTPVDDHLAHISIDSSKTYNFNISKDGAITPQSTDGVPLTDSLAGLDAETMRLIKTTNEKIQQMNSRNDDDKIKEEIIKLLKEIKARVYRIPTY